ncbi:MAG: hypothetical protein AB4050_03230 [Synechococcus sp.]
MSESSKASQSNQAENTQLKSGQTPPPAWMLRTLSIAATAFTILGIELIISGAVQGTTLPFQNAAVPTYWPGGLFFVLGVRNLWSWHTMKQAIERSQKQ